MDMLYCSLLRIVLGRSRVQRLVVSLQKGLALLLEETLLSGTIAFSIMRMLRTSVEAKVPTAKQGNISPGRDYSDSSCKQTGRFSNRYHTNCICIAAVQNLIVACLERSKHHFLLRERGVAHLEGAVDQRRASKKNLDSAINF